jgi:hypothetical protein
LLNVTEYRALGTIPASACRTPLEPARLYDVDVTGGGVWPDWLLKRTMLRTPPACRISTPIIFPSSDAICVLAGAVLLFDPA